MIEALFGFAPDDLLLFSETVYWRLFERANAAAWPAPALAPPVAAVLIASAAVWPRWRLAAGPGLAAAWAAVALLFLPIYREINWAVADVVQIFWLEAALLLAWTFARTPAPALSLMRRTAGWVLGAVATLGWPLLAPAAGRPLAAAEVVGVAPDPTALAALALALLCARGAWLAVLAFLPLAWCAISAATLLTFGAIEGYALTAAACLALLGLAVPIGRQRRTQAPASTHDDAAG